MSFSTTAVWIFAIVSLVNSQSSNPVNVPANIVDLALKINSNSDPLENSVFSPFSISTALNLLLLGSDRTTKQQLRSFLGYSSEVADSAVHDVYNSMLTTFKDKSEVQLKLASAVFTRKGLRLEKDYITAAAQKYETQTNALDFENDPSGVQKMINEWVANRTENKIGDVLVQPPSSATQMILLTVIYFKGAWDNPFPVDLTRKGDFFTSPGNSVKVDFMGNLMTVPYAESSFLDCKAIVLSYAEKTYDMIFLLPNSNEPGALKEMESKITAEVVNNLIIKEMASEFANVDIPKFKITHSLSLRPTLQKSGVSAVFGPDSNFSKITKDSIKVDEILHQAFIDVNEEGTEAAAATTVFVTRETPTKKFVANRPFAFVIRHNKLDLSLFHGRVVLPKY